MWLNNPRKPLEASGTSGMKAAINGVPHLSIGDGWWAEGFTGANGWVIDGAVTGDDYDAVDRADADAIYRLLEEEVVPAFYDRDASNVPRAWIAVVKEAIRTVAPRFSARRMVKLGPLARDASAHSAALLARALEAGPRVRRRIHSARLSVCLASRSSNRGARCAARRTCRSRVAKRSTAATAGTRKSPLKKSSRASSR